MRCLFLLLGLLLPQLLRAQFNIFEPGSYVLAGAPAVRHTAQLKLRGNNLLLVKGKHGAKLKLPVGEVSSFRLGGRKYVTAGGFEMRGLGDTYVDKAFVEQLDSGAVVLLRFESTESAPMMMSAGGGMMGGGSTTQTLYLLRKGATDAVYPLPANRLTSAGRKFREALLPHLANRPDLARLAQANQFSEDDLPAIVRALNTGQPFPARATSAN